MENKYAMISIYLVVLRAHSVLTAKIRDFLENTSQYWEELKLYLQ